MIDQYLSQGYLVFRGIIPPTLMTDLRVEADKLVVGPSAEWNSRQRIQPLSNYADDLNLSPFEDTLLSLRCDRKATWTTLHTGL